MLDSKNRLVYEPLLPTMRPFKRMSLTATCGGEFRVGAQKKRGIPGRQIFLLPNVDTEAALKSHNFVSYCNELNFCSYVSLGRIQIT